MLVKSGEAWQCLLLNKLLLKRRYGQNLSFRKKLKNMAVSAVSHQWFIQWSSPSIVFSDINKQYDSGRSNWNEDWSPVTSQGYKDENWSSVTSHGYKDENWSSVTSHGYNKEPAPVYENDYEFEYEEETPKFYHGRTKAAGITLWLAMMGLSRPHIEPADVDTPPFNTLYKWKEIDFVFPSPKHRARAMKSGKFVPKNVLPLGLEIWESRVFVTLPRWRRGIPVTLATVSRYGGETSPLLEPYPDWSYHNTINDYKNCSGITSVFRINADQCGRLWVLDSGQIDSQDNPKQLCPPSILVFDLITDQLLARYTIPAKYVKQDTLFSNIVVHSKRRDCKDLHAYIADTWRFGLIVFREHDEHFWRFSHPYFYPDPLASNYTLHGVNFNWADGIFGLALTPGEKLKSSLLFFHPMSSYREFFVTTEVLQDPDRVNNSAKEFYLVGESRGWYGQASASYIDRRGVMFYGLVTQDSIGCWNTRKPYLKQNLALVARDTDTLVFPNDIKVDQEDPQSVWVLSNRLPLYQAGQLDSEDYNYRILFASTEDAVRGTVCDPSDIKSKFLKTWFH